MQSRNLISCAVCLLVIHLAVAYAADNNVTSTNATLLVASVVQTTTPAAPSTTLKSSNVSSTNTTQQQQVKITTGKPEKDEDDCSDEVAVPEPEGDRQGKQLHLGDDKDKYTHEGGKAEPEPESEPDTNTTLNGKLTGNSTTAKPAVGAASSIVSENTFGLGVLAATTAIYLKVASSNL